MSEPLIAVDAIQAKQEEVEKKLSRRFNWYIWLLVSATAMNTFMVVFHKYDTEDSKETLRYKLGFILYMLNFLIQTGLLLGTFIYAFVLYTRLALFLRPDYDTNDGSTHRNSGYVDSATLASQDGDDDSPFERRRDVIRRGFRPKYLTFNLQFVYLLVTLTLRTCTYVGLRLTSREKILQWVRIKPSVIYLTYATDFMIVFGVLYFIYQAAPRKDLAAGSDFSASSLLSSSH